MAFNESENRSSCCQLRLGDIRQFVNDLILPYNPGVECTNIICNLHSGCRFSATFHAFFRWGKTLVVGLLWIPTAAKNTRCFAMARFECQNILAVVWNCDNVSVVTGRYFIHADHRSNTKIKKVLIVKLLAGSICFLVCLLIPHKKARFWPNVLSLKQFISDHNSSVNRSQRYF